MSFDVATDKSAQYAQEEYCSEYGAGPDKYRNIPKYGFWVSAVEEAEDELEFLQQRYHKTGVKPESEDREQVCSSRCLLVNLALDAEHPVRSYNVIMGLTEIWRQRDEWIASLSRGIAPTASTSTSSGGGGETEQERVCK